MAACVINYLADTLPRQHDLSRQDDKESWGLFYCPSCGAHSHLWNYFWFNGCKECNAPPALRRWVILILFPALFLFILIFPSSKLAFWQFAVLLTYFGVVVVIDLEHHIILEIVSITGALIAFALGWMLHGFPITIWGGIAGFGIMFVLYGLGVLFSKSVSRNRAEPLEEGALGAGDIRLGGVIGLLLGWPGITGGLLFAILAGGLISIVILLKSFVRRQYKAFRAIPYGPFLVFGALLLLLWPF
ncbi:MAG: prepilin peptidase [Anaerolineaceae bacterium]|nr:prepilin peptidase [Anaerolineaceae bacterium]